MKGVEDVKAAGQIEYCYGEEEKILQVWFKEGLEQSKLIIMVSKNLKI